MQLQRCEGLQDRKSQSRHHGNECRSRNNKGVWMVNGRILCASCYEKLLSDHSIDQLRICRLSDNERDFPESTRQYTARDVQVQN